MKLLAALTVALAVAPAAALAAPTQVTIIVPATQVLEGVTTVNLTGSSPIRAQLVVKSNVPWTLVARISGPVSGAALRVQGGAWTPLTAAGPIFQGSRGVHIVTYEVRTQGAAQGLLTLSLVPARPVTP